MLTESAARWLLVLHAGLGAAAVGAATHLLVWLRRFIRGQGARHTVVKFARLTLALQIAAFAAGGVLYPTYKVEVRAAYLENASALAAAQEAKAIAAAHVMLREHGQPAATAATADLARRGAQAARWFDVKEHWVALGILVSGAVLLMLSRWPDGQEAKGIAAAATILAGISAATVWLAAIIGILTTAWRAV